MYPSVYTLGSLHTPTWSCFLVCVLLPRHHNKINGQEEGHVNIKMGGLGVDQFVCVTGVCVFVSRGGDALGGLGGVLKPQPPLNHF